MIIRSINLYRIIELHNALVIINAEDNMMNRPDALPLVEADMETCCEYLQRYTFYRRKGHDAPSAHNKAVREASVIRSGELDAHQ